MDKRGYSRLERLVERALVFAMFLAIGFAILRYVIGAGHTLSWALAYVDASVSIGVSDLKEAIARGRADG